MSESQTGAERAQALPTSWNGAWHDLRIAVVGLGPHAFAAVDTVHELGAAVQLFAHPGDESRLQVLQTIGVECTIDSSDASLLDQLAVFGADVVVIDIDGTDAVLVERVEVFAETNSIAVWSELELGWRVRDRISNEAPWIITTGSRGWSALIIAARLIRHVGFTVTPTSQYDSPILDVIRARGADAGLLAWASPKSLQLAPSVSPTISAAVLPAPSDLEGFATDAAWAEAAALVYRNTQLACIYSHVHTATEQMVADAEVIEGARAIGITLGTPGPSDIGVVEDLLVDRAFLDERFSSALEVADVTTDLPKVAHTADRLHTVLTAIAIARALNVPPASIAEALRFIEDADFSADAV